MYYLDDDTKTVLGIVVIIAVATLVGWLFWWGVILRRVDTATIQARWWEATTAVKYDVETCSPETSCDDEGYCTTSIECSTSTYTRCSDTNTGQELPEVCPPAPCRMRRGDYVRHRVIHRVQFRVSEDNKSQTEKFNSGLWSVLEPGTVVEITRTGPGTVVDAEPRKGRAQ